LVRDPGQSVTFRFPSSAGTYNYLCSLHPNDMKGSVVVTS
jgi:plastocyanin